MGQERVAVPRLSIVTTLYKSAGHLEAFYERVTREAVTWFPDHELILVNDGSPDASLDIALELQRRDPRVRPLDLSRNFGHHRAIMTGLAHARGDLVFLIDCDLEEEPELLGTFYRELQARNVDVVYGVQERRRGGFFEARVQGAFYRIFNLLSDVPVPVDAVIARLMKADYVKSLVLHRDREIFLLGLMQLAGFEQVGLPVRKLSSGRTTYTLGRKIDAAVNAITSFSGKPLLYVFYLGAIILSVSGLSLAAIVIQKLFFGIGILGWASLIASIWFLGGLTIFSLGVIGIYLFKVFVEVKDRPYTVVRKDYGGGAPGRTQPPEA